MKQIEITVKVNNTLDEVDKILISKGFKLIRKSRVEDEYVCPNDINVNRENILKVLSSSVLIRYLKTQDGEFKKITYKDILETLQIMCDNSIYSYQNEIKNGYITVKGGHRVGITGNCVIENEKVININYISSINFRIAREIIGCGNKALPYILKIKENTIYNTLIISPPGAR